MDNLSIPGKFGLEIFSQITNNRKREGADGGECFN